MCIFDVCVLVYKCALAGSSMCAIFLQVSEMGRSLFMKNVPSFLCPHSHIWSPSLYFNSAKVSISYDGEENKKAGKGNLMTKAASRHAGRYNTFLQVPFHMTQKFTLVLYMIQHYSYVKRILMCVWNGLARINVGEGSEPITAGTEE